MDKIEVSQRAREAVDELFDPATLGFSGLSLDAMTSFLARFERDILATRTDATPVAWMYECGQIRMTYPKRANGSINGIPLSEWTETPLYTHPPATDVAALVEAAKACQAQFTFYATEHRNAEKHEKAATNQRFADDLSAALAPFTKGQDDE